MAQMTCRPCDCASWLLTAAILCFNSPPEAPKNWVQIHPNLNDYHSNRMVVGSSFWIPDITDWWRQQVETHSKYANFSNVACDIVSIIPHGVGEEASFSPWRAVISWRQSKTTCETLHKTVVVRQLPRANNWIMAGDDPALHTTRSGNDPEMMKEAEEWNLHRMAKGHHFLEMGQGSQNLRATQKKSQHQNPQMTAVGYIADTEEIPRASW